MSGPRHPNCIKCRCLPLHRLATNLHKSTNFLRPFILIERNATTKWNFGIKPQTNGRYNCYKRFSSYSPKFGSVDLFGNRFAGCAQLCLYSWNKLCQSKGQVLELCAKKIPRKVSFKTQLSKRLQNNCCRLQIMNWIHLTNGYLGLIVTRGSRSRWTDLGNP